MKNVFEVETLCKVQKSFDGKFFIMQPSQNFQCERSKIQLDSLSRKIPEKFRKDEKMSFEVLDHESSK